MFLDTNADPLQYENPENNKTYKLDVLQIATRNL